MEPRRALAKAPAGRANGTGRQFLVALPRWRRGRSGALANRARAIRRTGFTLIELLVVLVIIGVVIGGAVLAATTTGVDRQLEQEGERVLALARYAREQAELQTREYGLRVVQDGYGFVRFDLRRNVWAPVEDEEILRERRLPPGLQPRLWIEEREVVLRRARDAEREREDYTPQIMLFSNGDLTPFALRLEREGTERSVTVETDAEGTIASSGLVEAPR